MIPGWNESDDFYMVFFQPVFNGLVRISQGWLCQPPLAAPGIESRSALL
jgi:hypothetical protein